MNESLKIAHSSSTTSNNQKNIDASSTRQKVSIVEGTRKLSNMYTPNLIRTWEIGYGTKGMLSQGGHESVDRLFSDINLNGKKVLDVGCGLGGVNIYLAKKYNVDIIGVDKEPYMIQEAEKLLSEQPYPLKGRISLRTLKTPVSLAEFPDNSFDLVYNKEMLFHLPKADKESYVKEMFRVLKPGGKILVSDWNSKTTEMGPNTKRALRTEGFCHPITPQAFQDILKRAFFVDIVFKDNSDKHVDYSKRDIKRLSQEKDLVCNEAGIEAFERVTTNFNLFLAVIESGEWHASVFVGTKPTTYRKIYELGKVILNKAIGSFKTDASV